MKFPNLVLPCFARKEIHVIIYGEGLTEDGAPEIVEDIDELECNWQAGASTVLTKEKKKVQISGKALFTGDICPDTNDISSGYVEVCGIRRNIAKGQKHYNPDGTVNYTELDVV